MNVYRIEPTQKKRWQEELMCQTEHLSFWIIETYRWGYVTIEAEDEETARFNISYQPAKNVNGQEYAPRCVFEDWLDTDNDDLFSIKIEQCENCNAEDIEAEIEAKNWSWDYVYEKYGEPVETIKRMHCDPKITKEE